MGILISLCSLGLLGYSYFLFPFLMHFLGKKHRKSEAYHPPIAIVLSAYQEADVIRQKLQSIKDQQYPKEKIHAWIASDGSTDGTSEIISECCSGFSQYHAVLFAKRRGKPAVINELAARVSSHFGTESFILLLTDADILFDPHLLTHIAEPFADLSTGLVDSRIIPKRLDDLGLSFTGEWYLQRETRLKENEGNWDGLAMGASGGCYAIRPEYFRSVPNNYLVDDFYISFQVLLQGGKAFLNPRALCYENIPPSLDVEMTRRRRIGAGNFQNLATFLPQLGRSSFRLSFVFISHKVIRWTGPLWLFIAGIGFLPVIFQNSFNFSLSILSCLLIWFAEKLPFPFSALRAIKFFLMLNFSLLFGFFDYIKGIRHNAWEPTRRF